MGPMHIAALLLALCLGHSQGHGLNGHYRARSPISKHQAYRHGPFYKAHVVSYGYGSSYHKAPTAYKHQAYEVHTYEPKAEEQHQVTYEQPKKTVKPITYKAHAECQERGQYLQDPHNQCKFRRCVVMSEPWEEYGEIPLDIISVDCAPGTAVPHDYKKGSTNPCTVHDETCLVSKHAPQTKKPEPSYKPRPAPTYSAPKGASECHERGQYLADHSNKCQYRRCVVMSEPWVQQGQIPLDIITEKCPTGTAVPYGYHGGKDNPCSVFDDTCGEMASRYETPMEEEEPQTYSAPQMEEEEKVEEVAVFTPPQPAMPKPEPKVEMFKYVPVMYKPKTECHERGQYLPDPHNQCKFRRCVVMSEPWEQDGEIPLDIISEDCAPGTAVPYGYQGGNKPPCTIFDDRCKASKPQTEAPKTHEAPAEEEKEEEHMTHSEETVIMQEVKYAPAPYSPPKMKECQVPGQYLPDTSSPCNFRRCVVMSEPWEQQGQIPLDIITEKCAAGTSVPEGYHGGYENPCTKFSDECAAPKKAQVPVYSAPEPAMKEMEEVEEMGEMEEMEEVKEEIEVHQPPPMMKEEPKPAPVSYKPANGCHHRGQLLADPADHCKYRQCVVMSEPWAVNGQIPLDVVSRHCARGSAVPAGHKGGYDNPCTARDDTCSGGVEVKTYKRYH